MFINVTLTKLSFGTFKKFVEISNSCPETSIMDVHKPVRKEQQYQQIFPSPIQENLSKILTLRNF